MKIEIKGAIVPNDDKWIYDWCELEAVCPKEVLRLIGAADREALDVYINSSGGDIFAGSEIYSALREYAGQVNIHIVGLAASAASVIACAGASDITPTGMVMVHNVSGQANGDYHNMDKSSEALQKANETIAAAYVEKTGMDEAEVLGLMDRETWLSAKDAVELGLVDKLTAARGSPFTAAYTPPTLPGSVVDKIRDTVKAPLDKADIFMRQKAQAQLNLIKIGGIK